MYDFQLPRECRDFAELRAEQAAYPKLLFPPEASDIVYRPLHRKLEAAISAPFHVDEPKRASMDVDAGEQVFPQLGRVLQVLRQLRRSLDPRRPRERDFICSTIFFVRKKSACPSSYPR